MTIKIQIMSFLTYLQPIFFGIVVAFLLWIEKIIL